MPEYLFYHLTESTLEDALPALLEKSLQRGWRVIVQMASSERCNALDAHLWTYRDDAFIPHGVSMQDMSEFQPILLTTAEDNPNGSAVRFLTEGSAPLPLEGYERVVVMFDGHDAGQLEKARRYWADLKKTDGEATYWQQTPERSWVKKA